MLIAADADAVSAAPTYLRDYERHLSELKDHLRGDTGSALSSSFISPAGYWTSREKDLFFHALAVHSRLRPDLIADSIKSKNVLDVCAYIDVLDQAAALQPREESTHRSTLQTAMEVSDSWLQYEENQAGELTRLESQWETEAEEHRRSVLLANRFQDDQTYWSWKEEQESLWEKQDTLSKLGKHQLIALDRVLRDAGGASREAEPDATINGPDDDNDPALVVLSSSGPSQHDLPVGESSHAASLEQVAHELPASPNPSSDIPSGQLSPASRRRLTKRLYMRRKRAEAAGVKPNLTTAKLSTGPKPKRVYVPKPRPKKYMPRNPRNPPPNSDIEDEDSDSRESTADLSIPGGQPLNTAGDTGEVGVTPAEHASTSGRNGQVDGDVQLEPSSTPARIEEVNGEIQPEHLSTPDRAAGADNDDLPGNAYGLHLKGGVKEQYKFLSTLKDQAIDANMLIEGGYEIFNLSKISKLMRSSQQPELTSDEDPSASFISSDTIKLLRSILLDFVTNIAHRAISLREQEVVLKRNYKAWRMTKEDEITSWNVMDALKMDGLLEHDWSSEALEDSSASLGANKGVGEKRFVEDEPMFHARLPLHREIAPPFVQVPGKLDDTSLMPAETDMDELLVELDKEWQLDETDRQLEARYEADLWQEIQG